MCKHEDGWGKVSGGTSTWKCVVRGFCSFGRRDVEHRDVIVNVNGLERDEVSSFAGKSTTTRG